MLCHGREGSKGSFCLLPRWGSISGGASCALSPQPLPLS